MTSEDPNIDSETGPWTPSERFPSTGDTLADNLSEPDEIKGLRLLKSMREFVRQTQTDAILVTVDNIPLIWAQFHMGAPETEVAEEL